MYICIYIYTHEHECNTKMLKVIRGPHTSRDKTETRKKGSAHSFGQKSKISAPTHPTQVSQKKERKIREGEIHSLCFFLFFCVGNPRCRKSFFFVCVCVFCTVWLWLWLWGAQQISVCVWVCVCVFMSLSLSLSGFHTHSSLLAAQQVGFS